MIFLPGSLIGLLTFPGVIVHELAHYLFCRWLRVAVFEVCYLRVGSPVGYVVHEKPRLPLHSLLIGVGPFFINTLLGALIATPAVLQWQLRIIGPLDAILLWVGGSIAMHAFPSVQDAKSIWEALRQPNASLGLKVLGYPIVGIIYLFSLGSYFWLDLAYGITVTALVPLLFVQLFL